jgi:hypothetical protein
MTLFMHLFPCFIKYFSYFNILIFYKDKIIILFMLAFNLVKSLSTIGFKLVTIETSVGIARGQCQKTVQQK